MRAISDYVAEHFRAFGIPDVTEHVLVGGRQTILFADGTRIFASPFASDAEIVAVTREAFKMTEETKPDAPAQTADRLPAVELTETVQKPKSDEPRMGGIMSKGYRPGSLKALLDGLHAEGQSLMQGVAEEAAKVQKAYGHLRTARDDLRAHREGIMSELGQFSNFADDGE
jgi:hypothetical protein